MKVLILEDSSQSVYGGGQKISRLVAELLAPHHDLYLLDYTAKSLFYKDISPLLKDSIILSSSFRWPRRLQQIFTIFSSLFQVKRFIKTKDIQLLYATTKLNFLLAYLLNRLTGTPFIYHAHSSFEGESSLYRRMLKMAKRIIAVSEYVKSTLLKFDHLLPVTVLYNPVEKGITSTKIVDGQKFNIGYFGSMIETKGVNVLMETAQQLQNDETIIVHFFGDGPLLNQLKKNAPKNCRFYGHVGNVDHYLTELINIVVLPSTIPEACPTIILQTMSKGLPVITTNMGGQSELVKDRRNGLLVAPNSPSAIHSAIIQLREKSIYEAISANNREDLTKYPDINTFSNRILEIFSDPEHTTSQPK